MSATGVNTTHIPSPQSSTKLYNCIQGWKQFKLSSVKESIGSKNIALYTLMESNKEE